jgi:hypothetical protein
MDLIIRCPPTRNRYHLAGFSIEVVNKLNGRLCPVIKTLIRLGYVAKGSLHMATALASGA